VSDPKQFLADEWKVVRESKTFKLIVAAEVVAVPTFVWGLIDGTIPTTKESLLAFLAAQVVVIAQILQRNTFAGIEAKVDGVMGAGTAAQVEAAAQGKALAFLRDQGHGAAADALAKAIAQAPAAPAPVAPSGPASAPAAPAPAEPPKAAPGTGA